jgi:hypothetical protein
MFESIIGQLLEKSFIHGHDIFYRSDQSNVFSEALLVQFGLFFG